MADRQIVLPRSVVRSVERRRDRLLATGDDLERRINALREPPLDIQAAARSLGELLQHPELEADYFQRAADRKTTVEALSAQKATVFAEIDALQNLFPGLVLSPAESRVTYVVE
jgi:hypothetical protein